MVNKEFEHYRWKKMAKSNKYRISVAVQKCCSVSFQSLMPLNFKQWAFKFLNTFKKTKTQTCLHFSTWISVFLKSHLECFPLNPEQVLTVWKEAVDSLHLQAADRQVACKHGRWMKVCSGRCIQVWLVADIHQAVSGLQSWHVGRHSQLGFPQTFRVSGLFSGEHPRLSCRPTNTHCTILSIMPSPQLTEHWRGNRQQGKGENLQTTCLQVCFNPYFQKVFQQSNSHWKIKKLTINFFSTPTSRVETLIYHITIWHDFKNNCCNND